MVKLNVSPCDCTEWKMSDFYFGIFTPLFVTIPPLHLKNREVKVIAWILIISLRNRFQFLIHQDCNAWIDHSKLIRLSERPTEQSMCHRCQWPSSLSSCQNNSSETSWDCLRQTDLILYAGVGFWPALYSFQLGEQAECNLEGDWDSSLTDGNNTMLICW